MISDPFIASPYRSRLEPVDWSKKVHTDTIAGTAVLPKVLPSGVSLARWRKHTERRQAM